MQNYQLKTIMRRQFLLIILIIGWNTSIAQHDIKMVNTIIYEPDKYRDYKGSPYLWKENKEIVIIDKDGRNYNSVTGNYNGLESEFEVYEDFRFIRLPHSDYISLRVVNDPEINYTLYGNIHPELKNKYCIQHANETNYRVFESFIPKVSRVKLETPGKATEFNKIVPRSKYYILSGQHLIQFKLNKKKIIQQFGHKKEINKFLKANKIKLKKIEDALPLIEFIDSNDWLVPSN